MEYILQAIKALFRKVENGVTSNASAIKKQATKNKEIEAAANKAQNTADKALDVANGKMDATNPVGTGSFSMNECVASGNGSTAIGVGTVAVYPEEVVTGRYNVSGLAWEAVRTPKYGDYDLGEYLVYASKSYEIEEDGKIRLVNPELYTTVEQVRTMEKGMYFHSVPPWNTNIGLSRDIIFEYNGTFSYDEGVEKPHIIRYQARIEVNKIDRYAYIVGNGTSDTERSNAHTLDWKGNAWYAGEVEGKAMIVASSTEGSAKRFKITVDDSGTIAATEVT